MRADRRRRANNRLCLALILVGLLIVAAGFGLMWWVDGADLELQAFGDILGMAMLIVVAGATSTAAGVFCWQNWPSHLFRAE